MTAGFCDDSDGEDLDLAVWVPHYLPQWSSRAATVAVDWRPDGAVFSVDGAEARRVAVTPDHPVQAVLAVFDFPEKAVPGEPSVVPELVVDRIGER